MVQILTEPQFLGKMVVILAGYEHQVDELLTVNPGLKSRFSQRLMFPDFTPKDVLQLLKIKLDKEYGLELAPGVMDKLPALVTQVSRCAGLAKLASKKVAWRWPLQSAHNVVSRI